MKIGENIKKYRIKRNMTQEQLANIVGVSSQAVSKWECEDTIPDGALFIPIADALGISLDRMCGHEKVYESDTYYAITKLIENTPFEKQMEKVREICWQTEKGLFLGCMQYDYEYQHNHW
jgi:transcriptional regulator with XRE-family HTH domain